MIWALLTMALAAAPIDAEGTRLVETLRAHAKNGIWAGVDKTYVDLVVHHPRSVTGDLHLLGAQAAKVRGELLLAAQRFQRVGDGDAAHEEAVASLERLGREVRLVALENPSRLALTRDDMPFDPTLRAAVERASAECASGAWVGLLPTGIYRVGDAELKVGAGFTWQVLRAP